MNGVESILLLRTAPLYQLRITALTPQKRFPNANITVVTNRAGSSACKEWNVSWKILEYPEDSFDPNVFSGWWKSEKHSKYDLVAAPYNPRFPKDLSNAKETLSALEAGSKYMVSMGGQLEKI
jgi:hypothetical protein